MIDTDLPGYVFGRVRTAGAVLAVERNDNNPLIGHVMADNGGARTAQVYLDGPQLTVGASPARRVALQERYGVEFREVDSSSYRPTFTTS